MHLFETFAAVIAEIPPQVVPKTLELQQKMLETDVALKRTLPMDDVNSILSFCRFVEALKRGGDCARTTLPEKHLEFYRDTVTRLVEAKVFNSRAREQFDLVFGKSSLRLKAVV